VLFGGGGAGAESSSAVGAEIVTDAAAAVSGRAGGCGVGSSSRALALCAALNPSADG